MRPSQKTQQPYGRLIAACGILLAIVLVSALMTTFLQTPNLDALADSAATAVPEADPTPTPEPTITPTPAVYAPFGAQYGYGGANLIPETPTPDPASVTPIPTAAPTEIPMRYVLTAVCLRLFAPRSSAREISGTKSDITDPARVRGRTKSGITIPCIIPSIPTASLCAIPPFLKAEIKSISSCILKRLPQSDVIIHGAETHKSFVRISLLGGAVQAAQSRPKSERSAFLYQIKRYKQDENSPIVIPPNTAAQPYCTP